MDNYQRLSEVSGLPASEILALAKRLRSLDIGPEDVRLTLNHREDIQHHKQAGWDVVRGLILLVATAVLITFAPYLTPGGQSIALVGSVSGAALVVLGLNNRRLLRGHVHRARALRRQLEGPDGFLWRFEVLLQHRDADGPIAIYDSLMRCCQASRRCEDVKERDDLVEYFFWCALIEMHLVIAEKGLHDEGLDPYEAGSRE